MALQNHQIYIIYPYTHSSFNLLSSRNPSRIIYFCEFVCSNIMSFFFLKTWATKQKKMQKCKKQQRNVLWVRKKNPFLSIFYFKFPISLTIWVWKQIIKDKGPVGRKIKIIQFESTLLFIFILYFRIRTFFFKNFVSFFFIEEENMRKFISEKVL